MQWWLLTGLFLFNAAFFPGMLFTRDSWTMAETAQSLAAFDGLALDGPSNDNAMLAPNGRWYSVYGFIQPLLSVPLVWKGWAMHSLLGTEGFETFSAGGAPAHFFLPLINAFICALLGVQIFRMLSRRIDPKIAFLAAISLCLSTLVLTYSREFFVQPLAALLLLIAIDAAVSLREGLTYRHAAILASVMGLMLLNRIDAVIAWAILGPWFLWCAIQARHRQPPAVILQTVLLFAIILSIGIALEFAHNYLRAGNLFFLNRRPDKIFAASPLKSIPDMLFNPYRSLFLYGPGIVLLLTRPRSWRPSAMSLLCMIIGGAYFLFYSAYETYSGGVNPGPRLLLILYPLFFLMLGMRAAYEWPSKGFRIAWWVLFAIGLVFNGAECLLDYTRGPSAGGLIAGLFNLSDQAFSGVTRESLSATYAARLIFNGRAVAGFVYFASTFACAIICLMKALRILFSESAQP